MTTQPSKISLGEPTCGVVFGGSSGVGAAVTTALVEQGHQVMVASRRGTLPSGMAETSNAKALACDVTVPSEVQATMDSRETNKLGTLTWVVNAAGVGYYAPVESFYHDQWQTIVNINILGLLNILASVRESCPQLSHFIQISSLAARRPSSTPGNEVYSAAKTAAEILLRREREHLRRLGVLTKVTLVSPGFIGDTEFVANFFRYSPDQSRHILGDFPPLVADDVAQSVLWALCSSPNVEISEITLRPVQQPD